MRNSFTIAVAFLGVSPGVIQAQTSPADSKSRDSVRAHALDTVAVRERSRRVLRYAPSLNTSALRTPVLLRDVPQSISVVTSAMMRDQAMNGMSDVVRYVPGVTIGQGEGNRDQIVLRGNASTADFFVDGVRDDVQYYRDVYNVDHVEALKGSNAMMFGRGGGGGVLNRVMKQAGGSSARELTLEGGMFGHARLTSDVSQAVSPSLAGRVSSMYQTSSSFREGSSGRRYGITPTVTLGRGDNTSLVLSYEHFLDHRTADRGIPSFEGRPFQTKRETFFGDPSQSESDAKVNVTSATLLAHPVSGVTVTNRTRLADYDKYYRNVFPGAMNASASQVAINAYDNDTRRTNLFNQTDIVFPALTGPVRNVVLIGGEFGRQKTTNFRRTGYFNGTAATFNAPSSNPSIRVPLDFRQGSTDADNGTRTSVKSVYGQNQMTISKYLQAVAGIRYEIFDIEFDDNRTGKVLNRRDRLVSPRAGLVVKPRESMSIYNSYSVSYLPSSGDQFSSLTDLTRALEPERFTNREIGMKWDIAESVALSGALYRLDRTNTRSNDPLNPARIVQSGKQRTDGYEIDLRGSLAPSWDVVAGFSHQDALILSATSAAPAGARAALVPRNVATLWNRISLTPSLAVGAGIVQQGKSFATIDNKVTLPSFRKVDAAAFYTFSRTIRAQVNVENLLDATYFPNANNNNNISVGAPRTLRFSLIAGF